MEVSYNYFTLLEKLLVTTKKDIVGLKNELLNDKHDTNEKNINTVLGDKITHLRHLFLRFYSLNECISKNYDYYCNANITYQILDLRGKGFRTISEHYFNLFTALRLRKTPVWEPTLAIKNIT